MLQKILGVITRPPVPMVLGTIVGLLVLWFGGHLLQRGYGWPSTFTIVLLCIFLVLGVAGFVLLRWYRARAKARSIENEIRAQARVQAETMPPTSRSEVDELQERFDEALESLKSSKLGRGALYALPWYVIIGPPGSGKTTAITESGLNFPFLKGSSQGRGIRGLGGTRNCDWWFTDQSILLDTAGRYTTQAEDHEEWLAFLGMIKRARKMKPINGVVVAIAITDILGATEEGIEQHATTIRQRIDELVKQLEVVFPVYLVFTKCDLLDGFVETFGAMSKDERAQVWGATFATQESDEAKPDERFTGEFDALCRRLDEERLRLLVPDRPARQQQKILSLSLQLRAARRPLREFIAKLTEANPYSDASELRGFYFTSGTQEGAPIDFVLEKMSAAMGIPAQQPSGEQAPAGEAKSYFIRDLFAKVLYGDRDLAHSSAGVQRRQELVRKFVVYGSAAAAVLAITMSFVSWGGTRGLMSDFAAAAASAPHVEVDRSAPPDAEAQRRLNELRDRYAALQDAYASTSLLGPSRETVLAAMGVYSRAIEDVFLLPARKHIEERLRAYVDSSSSDDDFTTYSQLVLAYGALDAGLASTDSLRDAFKQQGLWAWDPAQLGQPRVTASDSDESRHLEAFLRARAFDKRHWIVGNDDALLGEAQRKLRGSGFGGALTRIYTDNPALLDLPDDKLVPAVIKEFENLGGSTEGLDKKAADMLEERKRMAFEAMAGMGLGDTSSLEKTRESLANLDRPESPQMQQFVEELKRLRIAEAVPRPPVVAQDPVVEAYKSALAQISGLGVPIEQLVAEKGPDGYLLPQVLKGKPQWMETFTVEWKKANTTVERLVRELARELGETEADAATRVVEPIRSSLQGMFDAVGEALAREARAEAQRYWADKVGTAVEIAAARFPFSGDAAAEDFSDQEFKRLFRPGGELDAAISTIARLRSGWTIGGELGLSDAFEKFVDQVGGIRKGCFRGEEPPALRFHVADIQISGVVDDAQLHIPGADGIVVVNKRLGTRAAISNPVRSWPIGKIGALLLLKTSIMENGKARDLSVAGDGPWGLLRVLAAGVAEVVGEQVEITWDVPYTRNDGSKAAAKTSFTFSAADGPLPFRPGFFGLSPPEHIFHADLP